MTAGISPVYGAATGAIGVPMPADAKPKKASWLDPPWTQPGDPEPSRVYTRDELAERLRILTPRTTAADIRYWEAKEILPQAIRRRHKGATRTLYPDWYGYLVRRLRQLQGAGYPLRLIKERIRAEAPLLKTGYTIEELDVPSSVSGGLGELVRAHETHTNKTVMRVEVRLILDDGTQTVHAWLPGSGRPGTSYPARADAPAEHVKPNPAD